MDRLLDRILRGFERFPDRLAVHDGDRRLTYADLGQRSAEIASAIEIAAKTNAPVIVDVPRGADHVAAAIGALRAGRGFVPVDRSQPKSRVETAIGAAAAELIICSPGPRGDFELVSAPPSPPDGEDEAGAIAYIVFTSGSTGEPKGVEMGRETIARLLDWHLELESMDRVARTVQFAPLTFDVAWEEIFTSLALGGTLYFAPDAARNDPGKYHDFLAEQNITRAILPTAFLRAVAHAGASRPALSRLENLFVGGAQLRITAEIRNWFHRAPLMRLHNLYGPSETHVVCHHPLGEDPTTWPDLPPMGKPFHHVGVLVVDDAGNGLARNSVGELWLAGCLANGYRKRPDLTEQRFIQRDGKRWYRTGDLVRYDEDRNLWFEGRVDRQVKIDGHRIEPGEVEARITELPTVKEAHVAVVRDRNDHQRLVAYVISSAPGLPEHPMVNEPGGQPAFQKLSPQSWRAALADVLIPAAMPTHWYRLDYLPLTENGKVDHHRLPTPSRERPPMAVPYAKPRTATELVIAEAWEESLDLDGVGIDDNFFDLGGTSVLVTSVVASLADSAGLDVRIADCFANPTIRTLAQRIDRADVDSVSEDRAVLSPIARERRHLQRSNDPIAIVGMACRFPGANTPEEFWANLRDGLESVERRVTSTSDGGTRVFAAGVLDDVDKFDAGFFGMSREQAEVLDPQVRIFLECAVEALDDAGAATVHDRVGVYAGSGLSTYLLNNLLQRQTGPVSPTSSVDDLHLIMANDKEFLPSRTSYLLDLRGPSVNVNAACATALYAIHAAVGDLLSGACDVALAGAALVNLPQQHGHVYDGALPFSLDGHTRPFDKDAAGTVFGSGVGTIVLKRLRDAVASGDRIHAVIRGTGVSNDGAQKIGMSTPSLHGEQRAILNALASADLPASSISYIEAHGTATAVGDVIEIDALRQVFGNAGGQAIPLGSVKSNIGHLGAAAGMAGVIKAVMMLQHREIPPTLHFREANPHLHLDDGPFRVAAELEPLHTATDVPRIGVSAFGVGGFNAHLVLESAPQQEKEATPADRSCYVVPISAKTEASHDELINRLRSTAADHLALPDIARTMSAGRRHHGWRTAVTVERNETFGSALERAASRPAAVVSSGASAIALFAGHGFERRGIGAEFFQTEATFRAAIEQFDDIAQDRLGATISDLLYADKYQDVPVDTVAESHALNFAGQYALLRLAESKGVRFEAYLGHSTGHYVAACAAGVFSARDGFRIAVERGAAIERTALSGRMARIRTSEATINELIIDSGLPIDLATVNGAENVVVSGLEADLNRFLERLDSAGHETRVLGSLRAGHSRWMTAAADDLTRAIEQVALRTPTAPLICNTTGKLAGPEIATAQYWVEHMLRPVRFHDCLATAQDLGSEIYFELSGSAGLLALAADAIGDDSRSFIPMQRPDQPEHLALADALGAAFEAGMDLDWEAVNGRSGRIVGLARYPFERGSYWTGPAPNTRYTEPATAYQIQWIAEGAKSTLVSSRHDDVTVALEPVENEAGLDPVEALRPGIARILRLVQTSADQDTGLPQRVWLVFRGSQKVLTGDHVSPLHRALWGLGRILTAECAHLRPVLVDLPAHPTAADYRALDSCIRTGSDETDIAIRDGIALYGRLVRQQDRPAPVTLTLKPDRTYLVSGGLTGLGLWTATILADHGAQNLLLIGRRPPGDRAELEIRGLRDKGINVETASVDVSDSEQVDTLFRTWRDHPNPIGGIVHSAAVLSDSLLENMTWSDAEPVLAAKARGAWNLHRSSLRHGASLDFFALYSAGAALVGNYGQGAYAAANAYLDGLAHSRTADGLPAVSFIWGVHRDIGQVSHNPALLQALNRSGYGPLPESAARDAIVQNITNGNPETIVLGTNWEAFFDQRGGTPSPFYSELVADSTVQYPHPVTSAPAAQAEPDRAAAPATLRHRLGQIAAELRGPFALEAVQANIERFVTPDVAPIDPDVPLADFGLDSLSLIQLRNSLQKNFDTVLPPRVLVSYPTPRAIAGLIVESLADEQHETPPGPAHMTGAGHLSREQQRWLSIIGDVGDLQRVIAVVFHEKLDRDALHRSLIEIVQRHEVLRQYYPAYQTISTVEADEVIPQSGDLFVDLSSLPDEEAAVQIGDQLRRLEHEVPDPSESPSWLIRCLELSDGRFILALAANFLQVDGPGLAVFLDELRRCYAHFAEGRTRIDLPPAPPYSDYTDAQSRYGGAELADARAKFAGLYAGIPGPTLLPGSQELTTPQAHAARRYTPSEPLADSRWMNDTAEALGVVPFALILASYAVLIAEVADAPAVCVPIVRSSRFEKGYADTIGPFTQLFPVPVYVAGWSLQAIVRQVDERLALLTAHPRYPSADLVDATGTFAGLPPETGFSEASINYMSYPPRHHDDGPAVEAIQSLGPVQHPLFAHYDFSALRRLSPLHLVVLQDNGQLVANYWYHQHRFGEAEVSGWADRHRGIVRDIRA